MTKGFPNHLSTGYGWFGDPWFHSFLRVFSYFLLNWRIVINQKTSNWMITESIGRGSKSHNSVYSYLISPHHQPHPQLPEVTSRDEVGLSFVIPLSKSFHYSKKHLEFSQSLSKSSREYLHLFFRKKKQKHKTIKYIFAMSIKICLKIKWNI